MLKRDKFQETDLEKIERKNPVVLNSGGPVMEVETVEGNRALCRWEVNNKLARAVFPVACLSRLVPFTKAP